MRELIAATPAIRQIGLTHGGESARQTKRRLMNNPPTLGTDITPKGAAR
jgi:hypothetical protein